MTPMKRKHYIHESRNFWNYYKNTSFNKETYNTLIFYIYFYFISHLYGMVYHGKNISQFTVSAVHHSLCNKDNFSDWSLQIVLQKVRYDRPPRASPSILLIISTFTSIIMWFSLLSYSVITQWLLIGSYIIDRSTLTGMKVHGCSLIYHISKLSHHPVGYQYLQLE